MTNEQIKQNAEKYADKLYEDGRCTESTAPTIQEIYIAGAHSRDEELENLQIRVSMWKHEAEVAAKELSRLRNPWKDASVEKPPHDPDCDDETSIYVIVRQEQGNVLEAYYDYDNNDWRDREHNWRLQDPTHWMTIPEREV
jgi:hypothetical protein